MRGFRILSMLGAILIMAGEAYRSRGAGRPVHAWMDDVLRGSWMIAAAVMVRRPTLATRAFFATAWGVAGDMAYGSFFHKLHEPASADPGKFDPRTLTALLGVAFALAIVGLAASILSPNPGKTA